MKLLVLLLLSLSAVFSANISSHENNTKVPFLNIDPGNRIPQITASKSGLAPLLSAKFKRSPGQSSSNLQWQTFDGNLPSGAYSVYTTYVGRADYICKYGCSSGFYNPSKGGYCHYAYGGEEHRGYPFEILVNKDNYELLEWKDGSWGSVPKNSVKTCDYNDIYVGKNKYGLGKVHVKHEAFFLPWEGTEYWYKNYEVLTISNSISSENIYNVQYQTDGVQTIPQPPEIMRKSVITNNGCSPVLKTLLLEEMSQVEKRWDSSTTITFGVRASITTQIPFIVSASIEFSTETTKELSSGSTVVESKTYSVSVEQTVPPNHFCGVSMVGLKYKAEIPYTARLRRTYSNGATTWTSITGTYSGVDIGEVRSVVDRCEPIPNAKPCS